jgi:hypothetical protein
MVVSVDAIWLRENGERVTMMDCRERRAALPEATRTTKPTP